MYSFKLSFEAIGTSWVIDCADSPHPQEKVLSDIKKRIEVFDKTYSRFRKDSLVWEISKKKGEYNFPQDAKDLFSLYEKLSLITNGEFTLLVGNVLEQAGYDFGYTLKPKKIEKIPSEKEVFLYKHPILTTKIPYLLDFGGLGKGYLIDIISKILEDSGIKDFCVDGGGDMYYRNSEKFLSVGLEHPGNFKQVIGIAKIQNESIAASSGNRRAWDKFHHIINPKTLESPKNILATWVIAKKSYYRRWVSYMFIFCSERKVREIF